jgi:mannitol-1-/sugar-/sorbitol-6-phosphatase
MSITLTVHGILFDMDGVLISSTGADARAWLRWAALRGMESTFSIHATHGRRAVDTLRALRPDLDPGPEITLLEDLDAEDHTGTEVLPGVQRLLASLQAEAHFDGGGSGARWTIVTSASQRLMENRLRHVGLPIPATIITANNVTHGKPHPEPYLNGTLSLGLEPSQCLVIEDSPAGIQSGKAAGCKTLGVLTSHTAAELAAADWLVPSLESVTATVTPRGVIEIHLDPAFA